MADLRVCGLVSDSARRLSANLHNPNLHNHGPVTAGFGTEYERNGATARTLRQLRGRQITMQIRLRLIGARRPAAGARRWASQLSFQGTGDEAGWLSSHRDCAKAGGWCRVFVHQFISLSARTTYCVGLRFASGNRQSSSRYWLLGM